MNTKEKPKESYFYFIMPRLFLICDPEYCAIGEDVFDVSFDKLATNAKLLNELGLESMYADKPNGIKWFATYLSDFGSFDAPARYGKLLTNPMLRILIENKKLSERVKPLLATP